MFAYWTAWFAIAAAASPSSRLGHNRLVVNPDDYREQNKNLETTSRPMICRSNETHVVWHDECGEETCFWQSLQDARKDSYDYLQSNIMRFDLPFAETMGFHTNDDDNSDDTEPDGLADGLIGSAIDLALRAKLNFAYTDRLPRAIWQEYVLNYASLNEARSSVRRLCRERVVEPLFLNDDNTSHNEHRSIAETVKILNTHMWRMLSHNDTSSIVFVAGQTPAIFDPMSVLAFGYASCTGLAILFVEALRAAGVPARVAGTAAWNGERSKGNHNWVEVWTGKNGCVHHECRCENDDNNNINGTCQQCGWAFLEPSPAQTLVDTVNRNPCERWFCHPDRFANGTQVYAARLDQRVASARFPLAWEWDSNDVPAVDRTAYYQRVCNGCGGDDDDRDGITSDSTASV